MCLNYLSICITLKDIIKNRHSIYNNVKVPYGRIAGTTKAVSGSDCSPAAALSEETYP